MGCALSKNSAPAGRTQGDTKAVDLASKPDEPKRPGARDHVRFDELAIKQDKPKRPGACECARIDCSYSRYEEGTPARCACDQEIASIQKTLLLTNQR